MKLRCAAALGTLVCSTVISAQTLLITGKHPSRMMESVGPTVTSLPIGTFSDSHAIWGSTGQDAQGHIWFGITTGGEVPSAHLIDFDPASDKQVDRGNVVEQLERAGVARKGEHQSKIHSKIVPGPDGFLYFASMDEEGENRMDPDFRPGVVTVAHEPDDLQMGASPGNARSADCRGWRRQIHLLAWLLRARAVPLRHDQRIDCQS